MSTPSAGYLPSVQAYGGYELHSSMFTSDLTYDIYGWTAGVQVSWDIFDGFLTKGKVMQAKALYEKAGVELDDTTRRIELDVRTAYSKFIEATDILASQKEGSRAGRGSLAPGVCPLRCRHRARNSTS